MLPPASTTWPMVGYALVRELPALAMVTSGAVVAIVLLLRSPASGYEAIASALLPAVIAALSRSQPADSWTPRSAEQASLTSTPRAP